MAENSAPLDITIDVTQTKTVVPMVAAGHICAWRLKNISKQVKEKGPMLVFEWELTAPAPSTEGTEIKPGDMGSHFFENVALFDKNTTPPAVPNWAQERIAKRIDALLGTGDPDNKKGKPTRPALSPQVIPTLLSKELIAKMGVRSGDFIGNEFTQVFFPGDVTA